MGKKTLTVFLLAMLCAASFAGPRFLKKELPPRKIAIDEKQVLVIPQRSANLEIVVDKNAQSITQFAAKELKTFLEKALNTTIPITDTVTPDKISFITGVNAYSRKAGLDNKKLTRDAFMIRRLGKKIYILGTDAPILKAFAGSDKGKPVSAEFALKEGGIWRQFNAKGTLFGVYDFLERFAGVRFFFPNELGTVIPKGRDLNLPGIDIYDRPDNDIRSFGIYKGVWEDIPAANIKNVFGNYASRQRNLSAWRWRMQTAETPTMHGLELLHLGARFGEKNPEYFALRPNGKRYKESYMPGAPQLCYASGVSKEIYKDIQALAAGLPPSSRGIPGKVWAPHGFQDGYFSISLMDALYPCHCEQCWKYLGKDAQQRSEYLWKFGTDLAKRAKADKLPVVLTMFAYHYTIAVPTCEIPDNMHVQVCVGGPFNIKIQRNGTSSNLDQMELIKAWNAKVPNADISLYNYAAKYRSTEIRGIPNLAPRAFGKFYTEAGPYINGAFTESGTDNWLFNYLNVYMFGKTMWDNSCDWQALLKDHYRSMFGAAADVMEKLYEEMEDIWIDKIASRIVHTNLGPQPVAPSENEIWTGIYSPAKLAEFGKRYDLAEKLTAKDPDALARVKYIRRHFLDGMLKESKAYLAANRHSDIFRIPMQSLAKDDRIAIDGKLDEACWQKRAVKLKLQNLPGEADGKSPDTFVHFTEDQDNFYVAFQCREPEQRLIEQTSKRAKDDLGIWSDNSVEVFLNPKGNRTDYYQIMINSAGSISDQFCKKIGASFDGNKTWDSNAEFKIGFSAGMWTLEMAIPKKSMPGIESGNFCVNFCRTRPIRNRQHYVLGPFVKSFHDLHGYALFLRDSKDRNLASGGDFSMSGAPEKNPYNARSMRYGKWQWNAALPEGAISFDGSCFVTGTQSLKIDLKTVNNCGIEQTVMKLKPNTKYRLSYFIKTKDVVPRKSNCGGRMRLGLLGSNNFYPWQGIIGTHDWFLQTFEVKTPAEPKSDISYLAPSITGASGTVWFDDIRLEEIGDEK